MRTADSTAVPRKKSGFIARDAESRWSLTLRCASIGRAVIDKDAMRGAARLVLEDLRDRTGETSRWFLIEGSAFVLVDTAESIHAVRPVESELPGPIPLHATAVGKAAMARWTPEELSSSGHQSLVAMTPKTITSMRALRADLAETRRRGWGRVDEELYLDVGGVAAVAPIAGDRLVGIGVSYPLHRTPAAKIRRYGALVLDAAPRLAAAVAAQV